MGTEIQQPCATFHVLIVQGADAFKVQGDRLAVLALAPRPGQGITLWRFQPPDTGFAFFDPWLISLVPGQLNGRQEALVVVTGAVR